MQRDCARTKAGKIEVAAINPMVSMQAVKNDQLENIAQQVSRKLKQVITNLEHEK